MTGPDLVLDQVVTAPVPVLTAAGTLSVRGVPALMSALTEAMTGPAHVAVCDVSGLAAPAGEAIVSAFPAALRRAGGWPRASLHLAAARPELLQALRRSRVHRYVGIHDSLGVALAAASNETGEIIGETVLPPDPRSMRTARALLRDAWTNTQDRATSRTVPMRDAALLVTTELVANAVAHVARPFALSLRLNANADRLLVAVTDPSRQEPILRPPRPTAVRGRGMQVVSSLSEAWGVRLVHREGKTVWARL